MTDLVERVTRAIWEAVPSEGWHEGIRNDGGQNMYECQCMAEAAIAIVLEEAAKAVDDWNNPNDLQLHAGEMTAQERRTTMAVLTALAHKIRSAHINRYPIHRALKE